MRYVPLDQIAATTGFHPQELSSILLRLAPETLIARDGRLYSTLEHVIVALDRLQVPIPNDPRAPVSFPRRATAPPMLGHSPRKTAHVRTDEDDADQDADADVVDAEVVEEEQSLPAQAPQRDEHAHRQIKRGRRSR